MKLILSALIVYLIANFYIAFRFYQLMPPNLLLRVIFFSFFAFCFGSLFLFLPFFKSLPFFAASTLYRVATAWLIAFSYLLILFIIIDLLKISNNIFAIISRSQFYSLTHHNSTTFVAVVGIVVLLLFAGNLNYHHKRRVHHHIESDKLASSQQSVRVVGISDLHLGYTIGKKELLKWIQLINNEKPDIVVISGDLIDNNVKILNNMELYTTLQKIEAPVYACLGNHEYIAGKDESIEFMKAAHIELLVDTFVHTAHNITIVGRDDASNPNRKSLKNITDPIPQGTFKLLLDHQPKELEKSEKEEIDLQFSGHTHKGQVFPFSMVAESMFENAHGMLQKGLTQIYVSSGLGIWGGKFRIGTQSEYVVFDITHKKR